MNIPARNQDKKDAESDGRTTERAVSWRGKKKEPRGGGKKKIPSTWTKESETRLGQRAEPTKKQKKLDSGEKGQPSRRTIDTHKKTQAVIMLSNGGE